MIKGKKVLAVIPARGGSKGLPGKNIKPLNGKPLIQYTLNSAKESRYIDQVVVSSEDRQILDFACHFNGVICDQRPVNLATDTATINEVIREYLDRSPGVDVILLLQTTSPLRTAQDIDEALELFVKRDFHPVVSVTKSMKSPYWMYTLDQGQHLQPVIENRQSTNRQSLPEVFVLNGAIYISTASDFLHNNGFLSNDTLAFPMPGERSIDIDYQLDFDLAETLLQRGMHV
jgi:CMP-N,N'-diacetyllegionaminic acid synthase